MKVLFTGKGGSGSWAIRGEQLGAEIGATVKPLATIRDIAAHDVVVVVKRTPRDLVRDIRAAGRPWVYDLVDCYPQPEASHWSQREAVKWVRAKLADLRPNGVIWPTLRMREDCDTGGYGMVLPHHYRPAMERNPIRETVKVVGYEGRPAYLNGWAQRVESECARRGWSFVVNPARMADVDVAVSFRGAGWDGYVQRHWKSNVKLANAHGSGTPWVGQRESGYVETASGAEYWADDANELRVAFDWLTDQSAREQVADRFVQAAIPLHHVATQLRLFLGGL